MKRKFLSLVKITRAVKYLVKSDNFSKVSKKTMCRNKSASSNTNVQSFGLVSRNVENHKLSRFQEIEKEEEFRLS